MYSRCKKACPSSAAQSVSCSYCTEAIRKKKTKKLQSKYIPYSAMHTHTCRRHDDRNDVWYETSNVNATRFRTFFFAFRGEVGLSLPPQKPERKALRATPINSERPRKNAGISKPSRKTTRSRGNSYVLFPQKLILRNTVSVCAVLR